MTSPQPAKRRRSGLPPLRTRTWWIAGVGGALALSLTGLLVFGPWLRGEPSAPAVTAKPSEPAAEPVEPDAATAKVLASFSDWSDSGTDDLGAKFMAEAGVAENSEVSLRVESDTPSDNPVHRSLTQTIAVQPETEYDLSAQIRSVEDGDDSTASAADVSIQMGGQTVAQLEPTPGKWSTTDWAYKTGPGETTVLLELLVAGPTDALQIDDLTMTSAVAAGNAVLNSSFETYEAPTQIANESLILESQKASLSVAWRTDQIAWSVTKPSGQVAAEGEVSTSNGLGVVDLKSLAQGYYSVALASVQNPGDVINTTIAVLDPTELSFDDRFGIGVHFSHQVRDTAPQVAREIGFGNMRTDATWSYVEKTRGEYSFRADETAEMNAYASEGMAILPISDYGNDLYDGGRTPSSTEAIEAFANYTDAMVTHLNAPSVEIYNEFNNPPMNTSACGTSATCYLPLLEASYNKLKATSPGVNVVGPSIAHNDDAWLTELYQAGGLKYLDAVSFHPYDYGYSGDPEFLVDSLQQAENRIKEYNGGVEKPIWLTELGWSTASLGEDAQAKFLVRAETIALANNVEKYFWYDLVNDQTNPTDHEGNFGLVKQATEAVPALPPKPAGMAQALLIRKVAGKEFTVRDEVGASTYSYAFGEGKGASRIAWSPTPASVSYKTTGALTVTSLSGDVTEVQSVDGMVNIQLTDVPIFIEGAVTAVSAVTP